MPPTPSDASKERVDPATAPAAEVGTPRPMPRVGRFLAKERVGVGGMGEVYTAHDPALDRTVALKVLSKRLGLDQRARGRLVREAHALASVNHPNVVEIYEAGEQDDDVFIAMEYIEGPTLRWWLQARARGWAPVLEMFMGAGRGLQGMHAKGLVHRDFKPENVLVDTHGRARLIDFGLVRQAIPGEMVDLPSPDGGIDDEAALERSGGFDELDGPDRRSAWDPEPSEQDPPAPAGSSPGPPPAGIAPSMVATEHDSVPDEDDDSPSNGADRLTRAGAVLGTVMYMSPEQLWGETATAASDQFSFCVALFEALYGVPPYGGDNQQARAMAVNAGEIIERPRHAPVPPKLYAVLARGLSRSPEDRWPSMGDLLGALGDVLERFDPQIEDPGLLVARRRIFAGFFAFALAVWGTLWALAAYDVVTLTPGTMAVADLALLVVFGLGVLRRRHGRWRKFSRPRRSVGFALFVMSVYVSQDLLSHAIGRSLHQSLVGNVAFLALACWFMAPILVGVLRWLGAWSVLSMIAMLLRPSLSFEIFVGANLGAALLGVVLLPRQAVMPFTAGLGPSRSFDRSATSSSS